MCFNWGEQKKYATKYGLMMQKTIQLDLVCRLQAELFTINVNFGIKKRYQLTPHKYKYPSALDTANIIINYNLSGFNYKHIDF